MPHQIAQPVTMMMMTMTMMTMMMTMMMTSVTSVESNLALTESPVGIMKRRLLVLSLRRYRARNHKFPNCPNCEDNDDVIYDDDLSYYCNYCNSNF